MIKRILVALDPDDDTPVATRYAIQLAERLDASLTGLAVVDIRNVVSGSGFGSIEAGVSNPEVWEKMISETNEVAESLLEEFQEMIRGTGVSYDVRYRELKREGISWAQIIEEMKYHDLLVVGRDSRFFYNAPDKDTNTLAEIVKKGVCPTLIVTDEFIDIKNVLIAFDGSSASARSLQSFVHIFPRENDINLKLLNIVESNSEDDVDRATELLSKAEGYLKEHGFSNIQISIVTNGSAGEQLLALQKDGGSDMVVLGAHAVTAIRRIAFGSTTHELISKTEIPLFVSK